jgi:hypothetical protein
MDPESERRSRVAYDAWVHACAVFGVTVTTSWEHLLADEQGQWLIVYEACKRDAEKP